MQPESKKFLADALEAVGLVEEFTRDRSFADIGADKLLRSGVYFQLALIGEYFSQLRRMDQVTLDRITDSFRIVGFRNQIIHGYQVMQDNVTWQIIKEKLPILRRELEQLLKE
jgi:uncharacterized protein with HEPN domain